MEDMKAIKKIYERMSAINKKYGFYHKTLFHLHTPASHDYTLLSSWKHDNYVKADETQIMQYCMQKKVVPKKEFLTSVTLVNERSIYTTKEEWLSYILLANELVCNDYEIVVVTDHNSIDGISKLELAIKDIHNLKGSHEYPEIICGIEISCADRLHVVGIFDKKDTEKVKSWLDEYLISKVDGTYKTSLEVIDFFKRELNGISYIAHINSSDLFNDEKYLSGAYKKKLKNADCFEYIGVHQQSQIESVIKILKSQKITTRGFVIDNDSHSIETIDKNYFWIKSGKRSFKTLKEAFDDFEISVSLTNEIKERKYIKSVLIESGGFLKGKDGGDFSLAFSDSLNCFIGGRGTGKSTILQVLDYAVGLRISDERILDFICKHGDIWVLFADGNKEYLIRMATPIKADTNDNILRCFGENEADRYRYKYYFSEDKVRNYAVKNYLTIYEVIKSKGQSEIVIKSVKKYGTLSQLYDVRYSVNELVQTASSNQIDDFIKQLMFQNKILSSPEKTINCRSKNGLAKAINDMQELLKKRKKEVEEIIGPFNKKMDKTLRIIYMQNEPVDAPDFENWLFSGKRANKRDGFQDTDVSEENAVDYLHYVYRNVGIVSLLKMALKEEDRYQFDIADFFNRTRPDPSIEEQKNAIDEIFDALIDNNRYFQAITYLRRMVGESEKLSLEFNINSKTTTKQGADYKDVRNLSLGQKVVAMLDFIFGYGDFVDDHRPILIDQPEDNLDSQYIYKNLVRQLRDIKNKRQIIIATHSATIVTNAMADQVCVMCSDGENGWIERAGYPSEDTIKRDIVNYMEGGIDSFEHKIRVYQPILKNNF